MSNLLIKNAKVLTCNQSYDILEHAHIYIEGNEIKELTQSSSVKKNLNSDCIIDAKGKLVTPGLIDCHTHLVYGGNRSDEFAMRLDGLSYAEIAQKGGGILSTVFHTRHMDEETLFALAKKRLMLAMAQGVTTIEIKSGYGLDLENELKMLRVIRALGQSLPVTVISTFLGAHALPLEYKENKKAYLDLIIDQMLPQIAQAKLADFVDAFCESIAFSQDEIKRLFNHAKDYGFKLKLHAEQLTDQKGAKLAASMGASSVDHLEYLAEEDVLTLKENQTTAVLLPGAYYFLKEKKLPPIDALRYHQVPIAIATDANPGSSPFFSLPLMMNFGCLFFTLSIKEAWQGVTINAASALGIEKKVGSIEVGKCADLILWNTDNENDIVYSPTESFVDQVLRKGKPSNIIKI